MQAPRYTQSVPRDNISVPGRQDSRDPLRRVSELIDEGHFDEAREALDGSQQAPDLINLLQLKLSVAERQLDPASALHNVVEFLRKSPSHPLALVLYQELSLAQYRAGRSCLSHSHPPPARS